MPKAGDIKYCDILGGRKTNAVFVYIPSSAFWMGDASSLDNPVHLVGVSRGFWIQQTPLTRNQFENMVAKKMFDRNQRKKPINHMSWKKIAELTQNISLRMPTEAEWELAAKANVGFRYMYSGSNQQKNFASAQLYLTSRFIQPVAKLKSNNLGLYDINGYVYEWCDDYYSPISSLPDYDPNSADEMVNRVARRGLGMRSGFRESYSSDAHSVRLVWEI